MPSPVVAFPCGSRSIRRVCLSARESPAARLTAVVVFPTPPFWLTTAMVRASRPSLFHVEHYFIFRCDFKSACDRAGRSGSSPAQERGQSPSWLGSLLEVAFSL